LSEAKRRGIFAPIRSRQDALNVVILTSIRAAEATLKPIGRFHVPEAQDEPG
jgi:hypothetical protein